MTRAIQIRFMPQSRTMSARYFASGLASRNIYQRNMFSNHNTIEAEVLAVLEAYLSDCGMALRYSTAPARLKEGVWVAIYGDERILPKELGRYGPDSNVSPDIYRSRLLGSIQGMNEVIRMEIRRRTMREAPAEEVTTIRMGSAWHIIQEAFEAYLEARGLPFEGKRWNVYMRRVRDLIMKAPHSR